MAKEEQHKLVKFLLDLYGTMYEKSMQNGMVLSDSVIPLLKMYCNKNKSAAEEKPWA